MARSKKKIIQQTRKKVRVLNPKTLVKDIDLETDSGARMFWKRVGGNDFNHYTLVPVEWTPEVIDVIYKHLKSLCHPNRFRSPIQPTVKKYIEVMTRRGWFSEAGTPISFSVYGRMSNGFTRFNAILDCGVPQVIMLQGPLDDEQLRIMDTGKSRSAPDVLDIEFKLQGIQSNYAAEAFRTIYHHLLLPYKINKKQNYPRLATGRSREFMALARRFSKSYAAVHPFIFPGHRPFRQRGALAAFIYTHRSIQDPFEMAYFFDILVRVTQNQQLGPGTAEHTLHSTIMVGKGNRADYQLLLMRQVMHGLEAALAKRPLKSLSTKPTRFDNPTFSNIFRAEIS